MPEQNKYIEVSEKINWKEEFVMQGRIVRNSVRGKLTSTSLEFKTWYNLIPAALLDPEIMEIWEDFNLNISPEYSDKWLKLFHSIWNWAWDHGLVLTPQDYDKLAMEWNEIGMMIKEGDKDSFRQWAVARID